MRRVRFGSRLAVMAALMAAVALAGCSTTARRGPVVDTGSTTTDYRNAAVSWAARYQQDPRSRENILGYARALTANGQTIQAVAVLEQATLLYKQDTEIASAFGKALASNGDFDRALNVIRASNSKTAPDWRLLSAEGAILDQTGKHGEARAVYFNALKIAPDEPALLNNLGLSHMLTGEAPAAEQFLRQAAARPGANAKVHQNLALVLGMNGRIAEAEQILRSRLPAEVAEANVAYVRQMAGRSASPVTTASIPTNARRVAQTQPRPQPTVAQPTSPRPVTTAATPAPVTTAPATTGSVTPASVQRPAPTAPTSAAPTDARIGAPMSLVPTPVAPAQPVRQPTAQTAPAPAPRG